jgi:hypothetical protein
VLLVARIPRERQRRKLQIKPRAHKRHLVLILPILAVLSDEPLRVDQEFSPLVNVPVV